MPIIDQLPADETTIAVDAATFEWKLAKSWKTIGRANECGRRSEEGSNCRPLLLWHWPIFCIL